MDWPGLPAFEFEHGFLQPSLRAAVRHLAFGNLEHLRDVEDQARLGEFIWGQGMAIALLKSEQELQEPGTLSLTEYGYLKWINQSVREAMEHCHQEGIFSGVLKYYQASLAVNTQEQVRSDLALLPEDVLIQGVLNLVRKSGTVDMEDTKAAVTALTYMGKTVRETAEETYLGVLYYALAHNLMRGVELEAMGISQEQVENYAQFLYETQDIDLHWASRNKMRELLAWRQVREAVVEDARRRWGGAHPFVSAFDRGSDVYRGLRIDAPPMRWAVAAVEEFLRNRKLH